MSALARLRRKAGIKQSELASAFKVTGQTISNWENGRSPLALSPQDMLRLCEILGCDLKDLAAE